MANSLRLAQPEFADRLVRALGTRLRVVYESALAEVELWNKSAAAQLDAQLRERRRNFGRRLEAIERIQQAASGLDDRIAEITSQETALDQLDSTIDQGFADLLRLQTLPDYEGLRGNARFRELVSKLVAGSK